MFRLADSAPAIDAYSEKLDVNGCGDIDALSDGLLVLRHFGANGSSLAYGVVAADVARSSAEEFKFYPHLYS